LEQEILGFNAVNEARRNGPKEAAHTRKEGKVMHKREKEAVHQERRKINAESKQGMVGSKTNHMQRKLESGQVEST
jgi:hypothetical protein